MLRSAKALRGYAIQATDGEIGHVEDFYFDDQAWIVRYVVVDTGGWLSGRKVLLTPLVLEASDSGAERLYVDLTQEQVKSAPSIDLDKPVSRQHEVDLHEYYGWSPYWSATIGPAGMRPAPLGMAPAVPPVPATDPTATAHERTAERAAQAEQAQYDPHLRSMNEVSGYQIQARDGDIGHLEEFIIDDASWSVMYFVIDTRNWLPGKHVLLALEWITTIDWLEHTVEVDLKRETIKNSPEYDPSMPVNRKYETVLYDYYGRPRYWER